LKHENYTKISVVNRAQLIDDAFYFLVKGQFNLSLFLELSEYLQQETNYVAWFPMFKALEYMSPFFLFQESTYIKVQYSSNSNRYYKKEFMQKEI